MNKSLNQAFIKAYSKEKKGPTAAQRPSSPAPADPDAFIMRIDTASLAIQPPHVLDPRAQLAAAILPDAQLGRSVPRTTVASAPPASAANCMEELRGSIASQMLKAGSWDDQHIDALSGGFPVLGTPASAASANATNQPPATPLPTEQRPRSPAVAAPAAAKLQMEHHPVTPASRSSPATGRSADGLYRASSESEAPVLQAPVAPALESTIAESTGTTATKEGPSPLFDRRGEGDIFRLDRPSYTRPISENLEGLSSESEELSSLLACSDDHAGLELPHAPGSLGKPESLNNSDKAREVEKHLRRARMRIFNPVWEVDNLQWPDICLELLQQRTKSMETVAQNLVAACQEGLQVLAVTSSKAGEGRTTVACCLAKLAGSRGLNVAIVDGDIENPSLSLQTNLDIEQDWKVAILNQLPIEEISVHSIDDQVTLVPLLNPIGQNEMSVDDDRIVYMLQELSESFDLVIVDMGPMSSPRSLVTSLGQQGIISAVVAVVDHRQTNSQSIENCLRRIRQTGISSIGLVENFAA